MDKANVENKTQKGNDVITLDHASKLSKVVDYSVEEIAIIKSSVVKGTTNTELAYFLSICKSVNLNPFLKEIWCYKDKKGNLLTFAGRDGFLAHAQKQSSYAGLRSSEVRENDVFKMDIFNNKITHEFGIENRGKIIGAYAVVFRKDGEPTIEWVDFKTYEKVYPTFKSTWETHPAVMIKKVAELNALKKAFGLSGVQSEFEFDVNKKGIASPIETEVEVVDFKEELTEVLRFYSDPKELEDNKIKIRNEFVDKGMGKAEALEFIENYLASEF